MAQPIIRPAHAPAQQQARPAPIRREPDDDGLRLQHSAGNRAIGELVAGAQAKLRVGAADDPLERQADDMAAKVTRSVREGTVDAAMLGDYTVRRATMPTAQHGASDHGSGGQLDATASTAITSAARGGDPLPGGTRESLERAFGGADFSGVQTHSGPMATALNDAVGAEAFTTGSDIFFRGPVPAADDPLLAHELTHVVQQGSAAGALRRKPLPTPPAAATPKPLPAPPAAASPKPLPAPPAAATAAPGATPSSWTRKTGISVDEEDESTSGGTTTSKTTKNQDGYEYASKDETDVFDGKTRTTGAVENTAFKGTESAVKTIKNTSGSEIENAVEALARAGAFGESSRKKAVKRGALSAAAEGKATGFAGAEAKGKAGVTLNPNVTGALVAVLEASVKAGVGGTLEGELKAGLGPLGASIEGKLDAFAGAMASVDAKLDMGLDHIYATMEASAFAGAKGEASSEAKLTLGQGAASVGLKGEAMAGASAGAEGTAKIGLDGIVLHFAAEAFAGVKASTTGTTEASYRGRTILKAKGKVEVSAGVGGKAGPFDFELEHGVLHLSGGLAATLGVGTGMEIDVEVDLGTIAFVISDAIIRRIMLKTEEINRLSPDVERVLVVDPDLAEEKRKLGYSTYVKDFAAYSAKKAKQGDHGIKMQRVQAILDKRSSVNTQNSAFIEFDQGVIQAAEYAFGKELKYIDIQAGQIRAFATAESANSAKQTSAAKDPKKRLKL